MKPLIIVDLDGCISDDRWRLGLIDKTAAEPWKLYHEDCAEDGLLNEHIVDYIKNFELAVFTARPESVREKTLRWLKRQAGIVPAFLMMRPEGCLKTSPVLKSEYLFKLLEQISLNKIHCAIDDREDVLEMYRSWGLITMRCTYPKEK